MNELNQIITTQETPPSTYCVWMDAGVINYKCVTVHLIAIDARLIWRYIAVPLKEVRR
jgi:hypothetical protein